MGEGIKEGGGEEGKEGEMEGGRGEMKRRMCVCESEREQRERAELGGEILILCP